MNYATKNLNFKKTNNKFKNFVKVTLPLDTSIPFSSEKDLKSIVEHRLLSFIYNNFVFGYDKSSVKYRWKRNLESSRYLLEMTFNTNLLRNNIVTPSNRYYLIVSISSRFLLGDLKELTGIPMKIEVTQYNV